MRRPGTWTSELSSRACSAWQPQLHWSLPAHPPQQNQRPSRSHETLLKAHSQREQLPAGALSFTAVDIGHRRPFLNPRSILGGRRGGHLYWPR